MLMPRVANSKGADWGDFPPDFVADLLPFTLEVWAEFALPCGVYKETRITALFSRLLEDRVYGDETKDWAVVDEKKRYNRHGKEIARHRYPRAAARKEAHRVRFRVRVQALERTSSRQTPLVDH